MNTSIWMIPATFGAVCAGGLLRSQYERDHFVIEETVITSEKILSPKTLVFLSDMHDKEFGQRIRWRLRRLPGSAPTWF